MNEAELAEKHLIYKHYHGSLMYGTNHADSDTDIRGICVMPKEYYIGLKRFDQYEDKINDIVIYDVKKFVQLAMNCNPNIIESLWVADQHILYMNDFGKRLRKNRHLFLSKKLYHTYSGYAYSQAQKIRTKDPIGKRKE